MELYVDGPPAHVGWVKKQSKHLGVWRQRWMVLLRDGTMLFFPQDLEQASQGLVTGGDAGAMDLLRSDPTAIQRLGMPSEKFKVRGMVDTTDVAKSPRLHQAAGNDEIKLYVEYPSTRDAIKKKFGSKISGERARFVSIDADLTDKIKWKMAIREALKLVVGATVRSLVDMSHWKPTPLKVGDVGTVKEIVPGRAKGTTTVQFGDTAGQLNEHQFVIVGEDVEGVGDVPDVTKSHNIKGVGEDLRGWAD